MWIKLSQRHYPLFFLLLNELRSTPHLHLDDGSQVRYKREIAERVGGMSSASFRIDDDDDAALFKLRFEGIEGIRVASTFEALTPPQSSASDLLARIRAKSSLSGVQGSPGVPGSSGQSPFSFKIGK